MMNERMIARLFLITVIASAACNAVAEEKFRKLKGPQIRAKFSGMELTDASTFAAIARNERRGGCIDYMAVDLPRQGT